MGRKSDKAKLQSFAQKEANNVRKVWTYCRTLIKTKPHTTEDAVRMHELLLNCILNHENNMKKAGIPIPDNYLQHQTVAPWKKGNDINATYVPCKRCEFSKPYKDGLHRCTEFYCGPKREVYVVSEDDGCSRGLLKKHYE